MNDFQANLGCFALFLAILGLNIYRKPIFFDTWRGGGVFRGNFGGVFWRGFATSGISLTEFRYAGGKTGAGGEKVCIEKVEIKKVEIEKRHFLGERSFEVHGHG